MDKNQRKRVSESVWQSQLLSVCPGYKDQFYRRGKITNKFPKPGAQWCIRMQPAPGPRLVAYDQPAVSNGYAQGKPVLTLFERGCGRHWALLAKVLLIFLSASRTLFHGTMPPTE